MIDLFITNNPQKVISSGVIPIVIRANCMIYACPKVAICKSPPKIVLTRSFKNDNILLFRNDMLNAFNSSYYDQELEPNKMWENWLNIFTTMADTHAPLRTRKVRSQHTPWLTNAIKKEINYRDYLKQKATRTNSQYFYQAYKIARNRINKSIQKAKSDYYQSTINNNIDNPKQTWKSVNSIRGKAKGSKTTNISSLKVGDEIVVGDKEIADTFNSYFVNVGPILSKDLLESKKGFCYYVNSTTNTFAFNEIFQTDTFKLLCGFKKSMASGPDRLYARHIKDSVDNMSSK